MSFLQPMLLAALPLVALPIIIHLINQRRYQTVRWAAMMFLMAANRMSRGYARVRQWLIMAMRMAAILGLIFAVSRPLAGGWLGVTAGGRADTTIVVFDRSPSMQQVGTVAGGGKRQTGVQQLVGTLETLGSTRWILIESATRKPHELNEISDLLETPLVAPVSASADLPAMLLAALEYIKINKTGRTEIWICSDIRENDWNAESGRWQALRDGFAQLTQGVRFHLLAYPQPAPDNLAVRVGDVRRQKTGQAAELVLSVTVEREGGAGANESIPLQIEVDGARSELTLKMEGGRADLKDHRIALEKGHDRGWGRVSIPADANPADNDFWFVYEEPEPRRTIVVADNPAGARPLELAASISPLPSLKTVAQTVAADEIASVDWNDVSLLLWQAPLPDGDAGKLVQRFVERGGSAIFFPPQTPGGTDFLGVHWTSWSERKGGSPFETWRGDQDLLAHTASGQPLPVGQLQIHRYCGLAGEITPLATLRGGPLLLARVATTRGAAYFCATTPAPHDSSLAANGVVFYVMVQRALAAGAAALGNTFQLTAGDPPSGLSRSWEQIAGNSATLSTDYSYEAGIYRDAEHLLAVNRAPGESLAPVLADARVDALFGGLDYSRVDDQAGSAVSLIQEVWRMFLVAMLVAMVAEAGLCLPKPARTGGASS